MMRYLSLKLLVCSLGILGMAAVSVADEREAVAAAQELKGEEVEVEVKVEKVELASPINFMGEFGMDIDLLIGLGARIDQARWRGDVVELASAARVLAAFEQTSDKKAPLTAKDLEKESLLLARLRNRSDELTIVAAIIGDAEVTKEFRQLAERARTLEKEERAAAEAGEQMRHIGVLYVYNPTDGIFTLKAGGRTLGTVWPGQRRCFFQVHWHGHPPVLHATDHYGHHVHFTLPRHAEYYRVTLHQGHH